MELKSEHFNYIENLDQQRDLFKDCFPETKGDPIQGKEHYIWKFHSFPGNINSFEYTSYFGSKMVGYYASIPYRYKIGNKITPVGMVCDVMTSSKYRGKGIFTKMGTYSTQELSSHVPFTMGYPIRKEVIPGHLKVGWEIPFSMPLYMKFIRFDSLLRSRKLTFFVPFANVFINIYNLLIKTKVKNKYNFELSTDIKDVKGYDEFINKYVATLQNVLIKDLQFAEWRYSAPKRSYKFLSIYNLNNEMVGFVSFRYIIKEGVPAYGILDYSVLTGYEDVHGFINKLLSDYAKKERVEAIMTMMSKKSAINYKLKSNGFFKSPFDFQLIIKNLTKEFKNEELFNEDYWHLMWVDSDDL